MREIFIYILVAISIPFVWRRPFVGLSIYLGANIIRPEMLFWGGTEGSRIFLFYYVLIVVSSFANGYFNKIREVIKKEYLIMIWMMAAIYFSIFVSQYKVEGDLYFAFELLKIIGICALIYLLVTDFSDIQRIHSILLSCLTFLGLWGIEQQLSGNERVEGLGGNAWGDSNSVAAMFVLYLPIVLAKIYGSENKRDKWFSILSAAIMVALIICTKSRGGFLGLLICLVSFGFYARKSADIIKLAIVIVLFIAPFISDSFLERMKTIQTTDTENIESSARSRLILWKAGLMVFADNPIFGTGFLTYPEAKMRYEGDFLYLEDSFRDWVFRKEAKKVTHNTYIQMLSDCGIAGGLPVILLVIGGIRAGFLARRRLREKFDNDQLLWLSGLSAGLTGFAVCIVTIDSIVSIFLFVQLIFIGILSRLVVLDNFHHTHGQSLELTEGKVV